MALLNPEEKLCIACNRPLKGRADKKFCDDYCRNNYNNQLKSTVSRVVRSINGQLIKNRRILENMLGNDNEMFKQTRDRLMAAGFDFKYFTHLYTNKKGNAYFFCYEYGYLPLENDWILIVKRKPENV